MAWGGVGWRRGRGIGAEELWAWEERAEPGQGACGRVTRTGRGSKWRRMNTNKGRQTGSAHRLCVYWKWRLVRRGGEPSRAAASRGGGVDHVVGGATEEDLSIERRSLQWCGLRATPIVAPGSAFVPIRRLRKKSASRTRALQWVCQHRERDVSQPAAVLASGCSVPDDVHFTVLSKLTPPGSLPSHSLPSEAGTGGSVLTV